MNTQIDIKNYANLKPDTPFNRLFPDGKVPVSWVLPMVPNENAPPCYLVDGAKLTEAQLEGLAELTYQSWGISKEEAISYIREGLPLKCEYFTGVSITDPKTMAMLTDLAGGFESDDLDEAWDDSELDGWEEL